MRTREMKSTNAISSQIGYLLLVKEARMLISKQYKKQRDHLHQSIDCPLRLKVELIKSYENERQIKKAIA